MNLQTFLPFIPYLPFLAVLYALFALLQALRHKRQGFFAALLALLGIAAPLIAYVFVDDVTMRASLVLYMEINAAIVFIASLLTLLIERRNAQRESQRDSRSYGMLGLGLSILLAVAMFALPLLVTSTSTATTPPAFANATNSTNGNTVLVSDTSANNPFSQQTANTASDTAAQPEATQSADSSTPTAVATVLTAQTGLSADDLLAKVQAGSTLADLITANNGDQTAVIPVIAKALDDLVAAGGRQAQMISNFGSDTTQVATQLVAGTLGQGQNFLLPQLITGSMPTPPSGALPNGANGAPPSGDFAPPSNTTDANNTDTTASNVSSDANSTNSTNTSTTPDVTPSLTDATGSQVTRTTDATSEAQPEGNTVIAEDATPIIRPTRIVFPTPSPTEAVSAQSTEKSTAESTASTGELASNTATCTLMVDYNLNLRTQPTADGSTVLLSIPFGSEVTTDGKTSDGWYHVSYDNQTGWVKGEYVTARAACSTLATLTANS